METIQKITTVEILRNKSKSGTYTVILSEVLMRFYFVANKYGFVIKLKCLKILFDF